MSQSSDAMKLAASSGMTLKEAWAEIKSGAPSADTSPGSPDTSAERKALGIPQKVEEEEDTGGW